ncbi:MAG: HAD family phosphatase [Polyangiales bacterium]
MSQDALPEPPTPPFSAAIFDMDGLLLDSERPILEAWLTASRELCADISPEIFLSVLGRRAADAGAQFRASFPEGYPFDKARARVQELLAAHRDGCGFALKPGVLPLLGALKARGVPCAVASSTRRAEVERRLAKCDLTSYFQALVGGDEVERGKPDPDVFLRAAERLGVAPRGCVVFEDMEHGARGAIAAGMKVVLVPDLKEPSDGFRSECLAVLASLDMIAAQLEGWFPSGAGLDTQNERK